MPGVLGNRAWCDNCHSDHHDNGWECCVVDAFKDAEDCRPPRGILMQHVAHRASDAHANPTLDRTILNKIGQQLRSYFERECEVRCLSGWKMLSASWHG
jgi:hypothetical protein